MDPQCTLRTMLVCDFVAALNSELKSQSFKLKFQSIISGVIRIKFRGLPYKTLYWGGRRDHGIFVQDKSRRKAKLLTLTPWRCLGNFQNPKPKPLPRPPNYPSLKPFVPS